MDRKGQIDVVGAVATLITIAVALTVGLIIVGNLEDSTIGDCVEEFDTVTNSTKLNSSNTEISSVDLPSLITGDLAEDGNLTVSWDAGAPANVTLNGHLLGETSSSPHTFSVDKGYFANPSNVSASSSASGWNITETNITYYRLSSCDYTADAYSAMGGTYNMTYTGFNIIPIVVLLFAAVAVIGAVLMFRRV